MNKTIAVFDLKAFYATCECALRGLDPYSAPLVVCDKERGTNTIILSVSPYLKSKGIPSRCRLKELPKGYDYIYAVPRMETYIEKSYEVISILLRFFSSEDMLVYSIDEVFVDLTTYLDYYKLSPRDLCRKVNKEINKETGLLVSTGIGDSMFLAKVALDNYAKHSEDYIGYLYKGEIKEKLWTISPLTNIWGIGERTQLRLNMMGLYTMEDIANSSEEYLQEVFGVHGKELYEYANGIDESDIHDVYVPKETSISVGQVLFKDYTKEEVKLIIHEMNEDLSQRLHLQKQLTKCIHLYIGYSKEGGVAKQVALDRASDDTEELY
ncbi:MAG: type VI secretion protein ImpB, partial [Coprobacillus sp.]|nr:type VI secretion protein ImpB [Coprobacillus sp.]